MTDLRVCWVGDSYVAGVGDPEHQGWTGRLAVESARAGRPLTSYVLGVRRETSDDVGRRWLAECTPRLADGDDRRVVVSYGVNDATATADGQRVPPDRSAANLAEVLDGAGARGWPVLVVGPPPVADEAHDARTALLDTRFAQVCGAAGVPYASVLAPLRADVTWTSQVRGGDGAHPGAEGYAVLAELVRPVFAAWTALRS